MEHRQIEVVAAVFHRDGKIFATQRGYGNYKDFWEFPGGKREPGEDLREALRREIREELTAEIDVGEMICTVQHDYPEHFMTMHCFDCTVTGGELKLLEHEDARWIDLDDVEMLHWLPADYPVFEKLKEFYANRRA